MLKSEILAVAKVHPLYLQALKEVFHVHDCAHEGDAARFAELAPRILGLAAGGESLVPSALLEQLPNLKLVSVFGVGYDGIDVQAAVGRGVMVTHTPGVLTDDVADLALGLMLSLSRNIAQADHYVRAGRWPSGPMPLGRKLSGARLGIVGLGRIGMAIAQRALAFNMSIAYTGRSEKPGSGFVFYPTAV
ncbi:MAG: 2-hydroxyacid dehydrogenase, partial [Betaproteobacteria bacterium]|nr:2-hydroxyacid dehydrogenase [Betaproteobacteria bacterium]